jgi:hypothetical protein
VEEIHGKCKITESHHLTSQWKIQSQVVHTEKSMLTYNCQMMQGLHQNGTPSHYGIIVLRILKKRFPNEAVPWHYFEDLKTKWICNKAIPGLHIQQPKQ